MDECQDGPCLNNGTCVDRVAEFECICRDGFQGELCQINIDDCQSASCENGATCVDGVDGYSCSCPDGYQ